VCLFRLEKQGLASRAGRTRRAGGEGGAPAITGAPRNPMLEADWQAGDALVDKLSAAYISEAGAGAKDDTGRPPSSADSWASTDTGPRSPCGMPLPPQHCLGGAGALPASPQARRARVRSRVRVDLSFCLRAGVKALQTPTCSTACISRVHAICHWTRE